MSKQEANAPQPAIAVRGLQKRYPDFTLGPLDLTVPRGSIVGLVGENGAGKTTTLKAILGAVRADAGSIRLLGSDSADKAVRAKIGVVFEDAFFYETCTPAEVGRSLGRIQPGWDGDEYARLLRGFELPEKKLIKDMSRGMRMKFRLAAALAHRPELLILDEATSGLDPVVRGELLDLLQTYVLDENHSVLLSSHITGDLEKIADEIAYIHKGTLLFQQNKDQLLESYGILRCGAAGMEALPPELLVYRRSGAFGCEALVREAGKVRRLLPDAVVDRASIDEIMQFYTARDKTGGTHQ